LEGLNEEELRSKVLDNGWDKEKAVKPTDVGLRAQCPLRQGDYWLVPNNIFWGWTWGMVATGAALGGIVTAFVLRRR
jgi:hypothetical protein